MKLLRKLMMTRMIQIEMLTNLRIVTSLILISLHDDKTEEEIDERVDDDKVTDEADKGDEMMIAEKDW